MKNPTLREIAAACSVNVSTVSRSFNNHPGVSAATRKRVRKQAEKMGWRPNPLASAYIAHVRSTKPPTIQAAIAWLNFSPGGTVEELPQYQQLLVQGAKRRALSLGYALDVISMNGIRFDAARLQKILLHRGIPGVVMRGSDFTDSSLGGFDWRPFAVACCGSCSKAGGAHQAVCNKLSGMHMMLRQIRQRGYRDIALVLSPVQDILSDFMFFSAFHYEEHRCSKGETLRSFAIHQGIPPAKMVAETARWLQKYKPEVVIGDEVVWEAINKLKWKVPETIAFVSPFWSSTWPHVSGLDQCPENISANAIDLVATQLMHNERGLPETPNILLGEGCWRDGDSCPFRNQD